MSSFTDNFQRADGPLGANWYPNAAQPHISSGRPISNSNYYATCQAVTDAGAQSATLTLDTTVNGFLACRIAVKADGTGAGSYTGYLTGVAGAYTAYIAKHATSDTTLGSAYFPFTLPNPTTITLTYNGGALTFYVNGVMVAWARDTANDGNTHSGFYSNANIQPVTQFDTVMAPTASFSVSPTAVQKGGAAVLLTLTGQNTSWTAGNPGTPTFSVNVGSLSGQVVQAVGSAQVWFTPPGSGTTAIVTDPSSSQTATITLTDDPVPPPGTGFAPLLTAAGAALINTDAADRAPGVVLATSDVVHLEPTMSYAAALDYLILLVRNLYNPAPDWPGGDPPTDVRLDLIWNAINGGVEQPVGLWSPTTDQPVKLDTEQLLAALKVVTSNGSYNLASVISDIAGSGGYNLTTLLANIPTADVQPVLDALAAIRGDTTTSLYTLLQSLAGIRTIHTWSLGDVKEWIEAIQAPTGFATHADTLALMGAIGGLALEIAGLYKGLGLVEASNIFDIISGILGDLFSGLGQSAVDHFLDSINPISTGGGKAVLVPPIWPGESYVDWGEEIAIESNLPVVGDMHGVVVSITGCEGGTRLFDYDGITNYSHLGALAFCSDRGDQEPFQPLGPSRGIYTVKTMARATACRLYRSRNVRGTIRPWKQKVDLPWLG